MSFANFAAAPLPARAHRLLARLRTSYKLRAITTWVDAAWHGRAADRLRKSTPDLWLFGERGTTAEDNAFHLFRFVRTHHPEQPAAFVVSPTVQREHRRAAEVGRTVTPGSREHKIAYLAATHLISTHARGMIEPWTLPHGRSRIPARFRQKHYVFLDHGVHKDDISGTYGADAVDGGFDLFCAVGERQAAFLRDIYRYPEARVPVTGLARFDALGRSPAQGLVLFAPTWRHGIVQPSWVTSPVVPLGHFLASEYYARVLGVLHNEALLQLLRSHGRKLVFYPHFEVQQYLEHFPILPGYEQVVQHHTSRTSSLQRLIMDAELMITDFSGVAFDMAYQGRPVVYYQFDESEYFARHYARGYFDYRADGFGPVVTTEDELLDEIRRTYARGLAVPQEYASRRDTFFVHRDDRNSERIHAAIAGLSRDRLT